jgi:hypothetical protein
MGSFPRQFGYWYSIGPNPQNFMAGFLHFMVIRQLVYRGVWLSLVALLVALAPDAAWGQLQLGVYSANQLNSNPNRISTTARDSTDAGDIVGTQSLWAGYDLIPSADITLSPSYALSLTLWGTASEQNYLQHDFSLFFNYDNLFLFRHHPAPAAGLLDEAALNALAGIDPRKDSLVLWLYDIAGELADATAVQSKAVPVDSTGVKATTGGEGVDEEDSWFDDILADEDDADLENDSLRYAIIDDMLANGAEFDVVEKDTVPVVPAAPAARQPDQSITSDSLKYVFAESLLSVADSLDIEEGTAPQIELTVWRMRRVQALLAAAFPQDSFRLALNARLDSVLTALASYSAPGAATAADTDSGGELLFAPVSLSYKPLIRHSSRSYGFTTVPSDAGDNQMQFFGDISTGAYLSAMADSLGLDQYENTLYYGSALLEQQIGTKFNIWGKFSLAHESYPAQSFFDNTQTDIAAQLRYQPSKQLAVVGDIEYGLKSYREDVTRTVQSGRPGRPPRVEVVDTAASTSLLDLGLGLFYRPLPSTLVGIAVASQMTPKLHPRLLLSTTVVRVNRPGTARPVDAVVVVSSSSNISDDIFSWNGTDVQLLAMQQLPWELVATAFYDYNVRDYGQLTVTQNNGKEVVLQNRRDRRGRLELSIGREFFPGDGGQMVSASLLFGAVRNSSTNYATPQPITGVDYDFNFTETYLELTVQWGVF